MGGGVRTKRETYKISFMRDKLGLKLLRGIIEDKRKGDP